MALSIVSPALLSLLFVGACLLISAGEIDDKVDDAKRSLLSACKGAESAATIAVSLPHFMADSANERTAKAIEDTVQGLGKVLMLR